MSCSLTSIREENCVMQLLRRNNGWHCTEERYRIPSGETQKQSLLASASLLPQSHQRVFALSPSENVLQNRLRYEPFSFFFLAFFYTSRTGLFLTPLSPCQVDLLLGWFVVLRDRTGRNVAVLLDFSSVQGRSQSFRGRAVSSSMPTQLSLVSACCFAAFAENQPGLRRCACRHIGPLQSIASRYGLILPSCCLDDVFSRGILGNQ